MGVLVTWVQTWALPISLHDVSQEAPAGRTGALGGASGAGKSTILNLIPRFYDPAAGRVTVDGQDLRGVTLDSLRGAIGLVSQEILQIGRASCRERVCQYV